MKKWNTAVLGSTGLVGQQFARMLEDHPLFEVTTLCASRQSSGKNYEIAADWLLDTPLPDYTRDIRLIDTSLKNLQKKRVEVVFSALPGGEAGELERSLAASGMYVFSNARDNRMADDVPILIAEVNPEHMGIVRSLSSEQPGFIVTNSNCTTAGLALALKPLRIFGLRSVVVTTYQALSGAGRKGLHCREIIGNVFPFISGEEEKIVSETNKIFGTGDSDRFGAADLDVIATCCRVPVRDGHLESVTVEIEEEVGIEDVIHAMRSFRGIPQKRELPTAPLKPLIIRDESDRPQPLLDKDAGRPDRARGMAVTVGRIRKTAGRFSFLLLVHNTIRGAAGTCILNAELTADTGLLGHGSPD